MISYLSEHIVSKHQASSDNFEACGSSKDSRGVSRAWSGCMSAAESTTVLYFYAALDVFRPGRISKFELLAESCEMQNFFGMKWVMTQTPRHLRLAVAPPRGLPAGPHFTTEPRRKDLHQVSCPATCAGNPLRFDWHIWHVDIEVNDGWCLSVYRLTCYEQYSSKSDRHSSKSVIFPKLHIWNSKNVGNKTTNSWVVELDPQPSWKK